jgi:hypothetical protein
MKLLQPYNVYRRLALQYPLLCIAVVDNKIMKYEWKQMTVLSMNWVFALLI